MPIYNPRTMRGKTVKRINGCGYGSFLRGSLTGLQEAENQPSAYSGNGLGMGLMKSTAGSGLSSINKKLESLMVKASKSKPKNIKFNM